MDIEYAVLNRSRGSIVATRARVAGSSADRRKGLLALSAFEKGRGLWIAPCEAIHTFGMQMPIDALFLDGGLRVRKLVPHLRARRISVCLSAASVLELPAGTILDSGTQLGDLLDFQPVSGG